MESGPKGPRPPAPKATKKTQDWVIEFGSKPVRPNAGARTTAPYGVPSDDATQALDGGMVPEAHGATVALDVQDLVEVADVGPRGRRTLQGRAAAPPEAEEGTIAAADPGAEPVQGSFGASERVEGFKLQPGTMIHKYELIRLLGRGGMGTVWAAHDTKLGRKVAIKFLHGKASQKKEFRERFLAEARATAQFNHENIITIHDVGEFSGMSYLVLEFLDGEPLSARLKNRQIPYAQAIPMIVPVVNALKMAHGVGIIHRDLKPDNVFVLKNGGIKVLDFGLAKLFDSEGQGEGDAENRAMLMAQLQSQGLDTSATGSSVSSSVVDPSTASSMSSLTSGGRRKHLHDGDAELTRAGSIMGTYAYMSPEQWGLGKVDHQSDIWAAGVILFQMITGEHPFGAKTTEVIMANISRIDEPVRSVRDVTPTVPDEVAAIVAKCLQKRKKNRYATAQALLEDLENLSAGATGRGRLREDQNPYPGLSPFTEQDAGRFFGRDAEISQFIGKLKERPMLGVIGPSGAGKSSFIRAGVVPTLRSGSAEWDVVVCRPGRDPFAALSGAMLLGSSTSQVSSIETASEAAKEESLLTQQLRAEPGRLGALLRGRARSHGRPVLVYIDQFEELYTLVEDAEERERFATAVAGAAIDAATPVRVVLSMRSDFLDRVAENRPLMEAVTRDLTILQQPTQEGLRDAIIRPAALAGYSFEDVAIVDGMVASLAHETAALPLMQFAAAKLWEARDTQRKLLTRASYVAMGGVEGALVRHADAVVQGMPSADRLATRNLFQRLVTPEGTRAVLSLGEIMGLFDNARDAQRILQQLTEARLLVVQTYGDEAVDARVEIVHESLINRWQMLKRWLDEGHEDAAMLAQLREAARQWEARSRPIGLLWTGDALDEARRWRRRSQAVLTPLEDAFLTTAFRYADRTVRRKRLLVMIAIGLMAMVTVGAIVALLAIRNAEKDAKMQAQRAVAEAKRAGAAEAKVVNQMKQLEVETKRAKDAEALASNRLKEVQSTRAREQEAQAALQKSYGDLKHALTRAENEFRRAQAATRKAKLYAAQVAQAAKSERVARLDAERAKKMLERLLEREREEVSRLKALRSKIILKLPE